MAADVTPEMPGCNPGQTSGQNPGPAPRRKSRWVWKLLGLLTIGVAAAPSLVTLTGQAPAILARLHPPLGRAVSFDLVRLHWWAPVDVYGLQIRDLSIPDDSPPESHVPLFTAERIVTTEPLWQVLWNTGRGISILVVKPQLQMTTDESGSNLERTLTAVFGESNDSGSSRFPIRVKVEHGRVGVGSRAASSGIRPVPAVDSFSSASRAHGSARVPVASRIELDRIYGFVSTLDIDRWLPDVKLTADIRPAVETTNSRGDGLLWGKSGRSRSRQLAADLDDTVSDFPDVPLMDPAGTAAGGESEASRIQIRLNPRADREGRQTVHVGARGLDLRLIQPLLDLAGIELMAVGAISGGIDARLAGAAWSDGVVGRLLLAGDDVRVRQPSWAAGEWLALNKVDASGMAAIADDGLLVQDLQIQTAVGELKGTGELRRASATAGRSTDPDRKSGALALHGTLDLAQLASAIPGTLGLHQDLKVRRGKLELQLEADDEADDEDSGGQATVSGRPGDPAWQLNLRVRDLEGARAGQPVTVASDLRAAARGTLQAGWPVLRQAAISSNFGELQVRPERDGWQVSGRLHPEPLWKQVQQFADVPAPGLTSPVTLHTHVALEADRIRLTETQVNSADVTVSSGRLEVLTTAPVTACLKGAMTLQGRSSAIRTLLAPWHDMWWMAPTSNVTASLSADPDQDLSLQIRILPASVAGLPAGNQRAGVPAGRWQPVSVTQPAVPGRRMDGGSSFLTIDEADINLQFRVQQSGRELSISSGHLALPGLRSEITGTISVPADDVRVDLTADTQYDLDVLSRRWLPADSGLLLAGQGRDSFRITGSPSAITGAASRSGVSRGAGRADRVLRGSGSVRWSDARLFGLQAGPSGIVARLENELLRADPVRCSVNGGELSVMPQYDLLRSQLQLGSGSRIQNLQLTPSLCREWLAYVTPLLADSAEVSGVVSARVERFMWDFEVPERSDVAGELTVHQAQAAAGSSLAPLLQVAELLRKRGQNQEPLSDRALMLPGQTIPVQIRDGGVLHDGLTMELAGYRMVSSGRVGFDEELQMQLQVPLEKSSGGKERRVPVALRGTIRSPRLETGALLQAVGVQKLEEKLGGSVNDRLNQELEKGLGRLLDKL